ncbi:MAG: 30S ribosomal protein S6 [Patescibacteria group bacterium]
MQKYELLYIIPAVMTDGEAEAVGAKIEGMIKTTGASVVRTENLGKLKLAYPIKHQKHGFYMLVQFDAETQVMVKLDNDLRLNENVLRHQVTIRPEGSEKRIYKLEAYTSPINEEGFALRRGERTEKRRTPATPTTGAPMMKKGPDMTVEELDKKLDAILEGTSENV